MCAETLESRVATTAATTPATRTAAHVSTFPNITASVVHVITTSTIATTKATADSSLFMRYVAVSTYLCAYVLGASPDLAFATCLALRTRTICAMPMMPKRAVALHSLLLKRKA